MITPMTLLVLNILVFMMTMAAFSYLYPSRKLPAIKAALLLFFSFFFVSFFTLGVYIAKDIESQILFSRLRFLTLGLLCPSWLYFLSYSFSRWTWLHKRSVVVLFFIPGIITTLLTLFPFTRHLVVTNFNPITIDNFSVLTYSAGTWFHFHYLYSLACISLSVVLGLMIFFQEKGIKRQQIAILTFFSISAAAIDIYCVLTNSPYRWVMLASATFFFSQLGIIVSIFKLNLLSIVPLAMEKIFAEFPDPVFIVDENKTLRALNKAAITIFGINHSEIGKNIYSVLPDIHFVPGECNFLTKDNQRHFFHLSVENLKESKAQIFFFRQITLQKSIEARLNDNLEFKARLLTLVAHDLSGHIESQTILSQSILEESSDDFLKERLHLLTRSSMAGQEFVTNIMSWIKTQGEKFEPQKNDFEWNTLINEVIESMEMAFKIKNIQVNFESDVFPLIAKGDSNMISAAIRNLLSNSVNASALDGTITISLIKTENAVALEIKDQGTGMSEDQIKAILDSSDHLKWEFQNEAPNGHFGIGLKIIRHFISLHSGKFYLQSKLGYGTTASIVIPLSN